MKKTELQKRHLPDSPGVYFFMGEQKKILYIGKATSLRNRVRSYFANDILEKRSELIEKMVRDAKYVEWTVTDSVLEALILETNLIRTHKPHYNTRSKDDKSYNHLIITNEEWPRVLVVRGKDLTERYSEDDISYHFGPFPSGQLFREALKIVRRLFQFYDTKQPIGSEKSKLVRGKIDFNRQIGLYPSQVSHQAYLRTIHHIRLLFEGKKRLIVKDLEREMMKLAKAEAFEEANAIKRRIFALMHIRDVALIKDDARVYRDENKIRIEAYDIAHLLGSDMVGVLTVTEGGETVPAEYKKFKIKAYTKANDPGALTEILMRRLAHPEWAFPNVIVVDGNTVQKRAAELVLRTHGIMIPVVAVVKDEKHKPIRILGDRELCRKLEQAILLTNAEAHRFAITFHRERRRKRIRS